MVYFVDIVGFSRTSKHIDHAKYVPTRLRYAHVDLKIEGCKSIMKAIKYLDHVDWPRRLNNAWNKRDALKELKNLRAVTGRFPYKESVKSLDDHSQFYKSRIDASGQSKKRKTKRFFLRR